MRPLFGVTRPHLGATRPRVGIAMLGLEASTWQCFIINISSLDKQMLM